MIRFNSNKVDINAFYNSIKNNYSGAIRDRLFGNFFRDYGSDDFAPFAISLRDSLFIDASKLIGVPYVKKSIMDQITSIERINNKPIIESEFIRLDGLKLNLKSLKGSVFLIDTWFLGCSACTIFHEMFEKEIYPKFRNNKDFKVLSINLDKKRENWIKGIDSQKYTSDDYINVTVERGLGFDHPFLKYYNVKSAPWLLLVDEHGNILHKFQNESVSEMIKLVQKTLNKKNNI